MKEKPVYDGATLEELTTAHAIFYAGKKFGSTKLRKLNNKGLSKEEKETLFIEVYDLASSYVTGKKYHELSPAIRSEISHLHGLASDFRFRQPQDTAGPSRQKEIEKEIREENHQAIFEDWSRALFTNKQLRNTLHPEDDKEIIEDLPRYINEQASKPYRRSKKHH